jgi:hypothetical protein
LLCLFNLKNIVINTKRAAKKHQPERARREQKKRGEKEKQTPHAHTKRQEATRGAARQFNKLEIGIYLLLFIPTS